MFPKLAAVPRYGVNRTGPGIYRPERHPAAWLLAGQAGSMTQVAEDAEG